MKNMSLEELGNFLKDKSNESIYENLQVRFPNGDVAGIQEIQQRYNSLLDKSKESEKKLENGEDLFEGLNVDDLKSILDQFYERDIQDNLHVELSNGNVVGLDAIKKKYDEFIALNIVADHPERDFFANVSDDELQSLLDNRENFDDVYLNIPVTLSNGNVVGLRDVQDRYNSMVDDKTDGIISSGTSDLPNEKEEQSELGEPLLKRLEQAETRIAQLNERVNELEEQKKKLMEEVAKLSAFTDSLGLPKLNQNQPDLEPTKIQLPAAIDPTKDKTKGLQPDLEPGEFEPPVPVQPAPVVGQDGNVEPSAREIPDFVKLPTFKVTFKNGDFNIDGYTDLEVRKEEVIHGPVIDPVPLDKNGKKKRFTAKTFAGWKDQYGNDVDLSMPLNRDVVLIAQYKFDMKKAVAVGLGAAVGTAAYIADLAVPISVPVISTAGAIGFGAASRFHNRRLVNIEHQNEVKASQITAFEKIPEELKEEIAEAKRQGYIHTFLNTAVVACTISGAAHGIKNFVKSSKVNASVSNTQPSRFGAPNENVVRSVPSQPSTGSGVSGGNVTPSVPSGNVSPSVPSGNGTTTIIGDYTPNGQVFKTAAEALEGTHGLHPYFPSFEGTETFEAYFNGARAMIKPGQSLESILQSVGATDPSQVAVNVMNSNGVPLTWEKLTNILVEGVEQGINLAA